MKQFLSRMDDVIKMFSSGKRKQYFPMEERTLCMALVVATPRSTAW